MSATNSENLEQRFDAGESVLDYLETVVTLTIGRLADLARILNMSALSRESVRSLRDMEDDENRCPSIVHQPAVSDQAGINIQTLQAKIRRRTPLSGSETRRIVLALRRHHLVAVA